MAKKIRADGKITFQLQYRKCGKPTCKCNHGEPHGPYGYYYYRQNGRLKSAYVGKMKEEGV